jgi:hypothetical protein
MDKRIWKKYIKVMNDQRVEVDTLLNNKSFKEDKIVELFSDLLLGKNKELLRETIIKVASITPPTIPKVDFVNEVLRELS